MIKKKLLFIIILSSFSVLVNAGQYDKIQKQNNKAQERRQEINRLINEGQLLINKIDELVARRFQLDKKQLGTVLSFIKSTNSQIIKEKQYQKVAQQRCNQTGLQEHCSIAKMHVANINILRARLKILNMTKQNILIKKTPVPLPKN